MILATDLDGTFLGGKKSDRLKLYKLLKQHKNIKLIYVTGRGVESVVPLLNDPLLPVPHYIVCDVGSTVLRGDLTAVQPLQSEIEARWPGVHTIKKHFKKIEGLSFQTVAQERRCSYYYNEDTDLAAVKKISDSLDLDILVSAGLYLDILPRNTNKGSTLKMLAALEGFDVEKILVAGDTMNDFSMFTEGFKGVVVGQAEAKLVDATRDLSNVYTAKAAGAGGILEAMRNFTPFNHWLEGQQDATEKGDTGLIMMYHRFPFEFKKMNGVTTKTSPKSPNGIIPSLMSFFSNGRQGAWLAWDEIRPQTKNEPIDRYVDEEKYPNLIASRIPLSKKEIDIFYKTFSKEALWPIIFSFADKGKFSYDHWNTYVKVNEMFARKAAEEAEENAIVWIHEYNLWMVPGMLRQLRPDITIGFFHHTSFPPADIFNIIPWRREIIGSMLQCDYIGFHIPRYVENFVDVVRSHTPIEVTKTKNCADQFLTYSCALGVDEMTLEFNTGGHTVKLGAHPVGTDTQQIKKLTKQHNTWQKVEEMRMQTQTADKKIILSVERLDYVKGVLEKIHAFRLFLEQHPEWHGKVELINICTPPAAGMKIYDKIQKELEQAVGEINGRFARMDWTPIHFFFRYVPFEEILTYYALADIAWITPLRDGLNLVAKEFIAVKGSHPDSGGSLIISEFAGASVELTYAFRTNPYDEVDLVEVLHQALNTSPEDAKLRMKRLYEHVSYYDIDFWGKSFMNELEAIANNNVSHLQTGVSEKALS